MDQIKVPEMQNLSMVFLTLASNFNYNHRVEHKKLLLKKFHLGFQVSLFSPGGTFYDSPYYRIF
jgi:hypothetical protein